MSLITEYRPTGLDMYYGQDKLVRMIRKILDRESIPNTFLITGQPGAGKTTLGRCIAYELGAFNPDDSHNPDYVEIDAGQLRGIDTIREVRSNLMISPFNKYRVWLFDECHEATKQASEAMLKMLEEPPAYCIFILCTTNPEKISTTIKRRATQIQIPKVPDEDISDFLTYVMEEEEAKPDKKLVKEIVKKADGSIGVALGILSSAMDAETTEDALRIVGSYEGVEEETKKLCQLLIKQDKSTWPQIVEVLKGLEQKGEEPERVRRAVLGYCKACYSNPKIAPLIFLVSSSFEKNVWDSGYPGLYNRAFDAMMG